MAQQLVWLAQECWRIRAPWRFAMSIYRPQTDSGAIGAAPILQTGSGRRAALTQGVPPLMQGHALRSGAPTGMSSDWQLARSVEAVFVHPLHRNKSIWEQ